MPRYPCPNAPECGTGADHQNVAGRVRKLDRSARFRRQGVSQPGARGAGSMGPPAAARRQRFAKHRIEQDSRPFGTHRELDLAVAALGADIEPAAADQRIARQQPEV